MMILVTDKNATTKGKYTILYKMHILPESLTENLHILNIDYFINL